VAEPEKVAESEKMAEPEKVAEPETSAKITTDLPKEDVTMTKENVAEGCKSSSEPVDKPISEIPETEEEIESIPRKEDENTKASTQAEIPLEKFSEGVDKNTAVNIEEDASNKKSEVSDKKEDESQIIQTETDHSIKKDNKSENVSNLPPEAGLSNKLNPEEIVSKSEMDHTNLSEKEDKSSDSDLKLDSVVEKDATTELAKQEVVSNRKPESDKIVESEPAEKMDQESSGPTESTPSSDPVAAENGHTQPPVLAETPLQAPVKKMSENFSVASLISSSFGPGSSLPPKETEKEGVEASKQMSTSPPVPLKKRCLADSANYDEADPKKAKLNEEVDNGGIVGEVIAEPVAEVKGQGSGAECDAGNTKPEDTDRQQGDGIVGEVVEEVVFRIEGRGSGFECEARNTKAASAKAGAAQKQKSNGVKADNNSNVDKNSSTKGAKKKKEESDDDDDDEEDEESDEDEDESEDDDDEEEEKEPHRKKAGEQNEKNNDKKVEKENDKEDSHADEEKKKNPPSAPSGRGRGRGRGRGGRGGDVSSRKKKSSDDEGSEAGDEKTKHSSKKDKDEVIS